MSYVQRSPDCGRAHSTAQEESARRVSVLFGMFAGQSNTRAVSAGEVLGLIPRNNALGRLEITGMFVQVREDTKCRK